MTIGDLKNLIRYLPDNCILYIEDPTEVVTFVDVVVVEMDELCHIELIRSR
jgi:hypothetical protein